MTFDPSQHPRTTDGQFAKKVGAAAEVTLSKAKPDTLVQDIRDSWDERHTKKADIAYRIGEAETVMRTASWMPGRAITDATRREADRYLSAEYRLAEALAERDGSRAAAMTAANAAGRATGNAGAAIVGGIGNAIATVITAPRKLKMWRLKRFSARHPELRELDATVNSRPETRKELIDARASAFVKEAGHPDPIAFAKTMTEFFRLDAPPSPAISRKDAAVRASVGRTVDNVMPAAREAYLNDDRELYLAYAPMDGWQGAGHNSMTPDPSRGGKR